MRRQTRPNQSNPPLRALRTMRRRLASALLSSAAFLVVRKMSQAQQRKRPRARPRLLFQPKATRLLLSQILPRRSMSQLRASQLTLLPSLRQSIRPSQLMIPLQPVCMLRLPRDLLPPKALLLPRIKVVSWVSSRDRTPARPRYFIRQIW